MKYLLVAILIANCVMIWMMINAPYYDEKSNKFYYKRKKNETEKENDDPVF